MIDATRKANEISNLATEMENEIIDLRLRLETISKTLPIGSYDSQRRRYTFDEGTFERLITLASALEGQE